MLPTIPVVAMIKSPGLYEFHVAPPSVLYKYVSVIVPVPPLPALKVADTDAPTQTVAPSAGAGLIVGETGSGTTLYVFVSE